MKLPTFIKWTSPFSTSWLLDVVFHSYSNFNRAICKQTVESLIRYCSLSRWILVCTICLCPTKRTLGLYGLNTLVVYVTHINCIVSIVLNWIMIGYRAVLTICIGMAFAICETETATIKTVFLLWQGLTSALMFHFSISTNIVIKKGNFRK